MELSVFMEIQGNVIIVALMDCVFGKSMFLV